MPGSDDEMDTEGLPEGAVMLHGIEMVSFLDPSGQLRWSWRAFGEPTLDQVLGLIAMGGAFAAAPGHGGDGRLRERR